jgi:hypothetical protein
MNPEEIDSYDLTPEESYRLGSWYDGMLDYRDAEHIYMRAIFFYEIAARYEHVKSIEALIFLYNGYGECRWYGYSSSSSIPNYDRVDELTDLLKSIAQYPH